MYSWGSDPMKLLITVYSKDAFRVVEDPLGLGVFSHRVDSAL